MATKKNPEISKTDSKKPVAVKVRVHPINVGQGDAILLEVEYSDALFKRYLIDGSRGQSRTVANTFNNETKNSEKVVVTPFNNLITALDKKGCILEKDEHNQRQITLAAIVNTHPDADHCGGINALLGTGSKSGEKFTARCPIITTDAASVYVTNEISGNKSTYQAYDSADDCPHFWFPNTQGLVLKNVHQQSTVEITKNDLETGDFNETSILTTVLIPESTYKYDVVLTGDSNCKIILDKLGLKSEKDMPRETVGVFQVPHHGSKKNSSMARTKEQGSYLSCHTFYTTFVAKIYLISHGNRYDHPHSEVITGILSAAVQNKNKCKIVVTATQFESSSSEEKAKINYDEGNDIYNWRDYVDIYYFKKDILYVTLDHTDETVPDDLQLYSKKEEKDKCDKREHSIEKGSSSAILEETLITEEGSSSAIPNKSEETPITKHSKSRIKSMKPKVLFERCRICNEPENPNDEWYECTNRICPIKIHTSCEKKTRKYPYSKCKYCRTCKECTKEMKTPLHDSFCQVCGGAGMAGCIKKCGQAKGEYTCKKCRE